jgi:hypothetical protein
MVSLFTGDTIFLSMLLCLSYCEKSCFQNKCVIKFQFREETGKMDINNNVNAIKRTNTIALCVIAVLQVIMLLVIGFVLNIFRSEADMDDYIYYLIIAFFAVGYILMDIYFYVKRIYKVGCLSASIPVKCIVEDLVTFSYPDDGRRSFYKYPIIKNTDTGELMFTYGDHCLGGKSTAATVGDIVYAYIYKPVPVHVKIDESRNIVKLNRSKFKFVHMNEDYDIYVFDELRFFEGLVIAECGIFDKIH